MTKQALMILTVVLSVIGGAAALVIVPRASLSLAYGAWHLWPYILLAVLALVLPRLAYVWLVAAVFMAFVDAWVLAETLMASSSRVLMAMGVLAALKPVVLLPIGALLGGLVHWYVARSS